MQAELNRKPSTVYFSDIVGYTRLMGKDENAAFELMKENLQVHQEILAKYRGQLIKELGDGILAVFETSADALNAGLEIQKQCNANGRYQLRIGLQSGEIIFDHGDIFGDAVNIASRIQSVGIPNSIVFSDRVCREIGESPSFQTLRIGAFSLKNVEQTLELHALTNEPLAVPRRADILGNIKYQEQSPWKTRVGIGAIVLLCLALVYSVFWGDAGWGKEKSVAVLPFANLSGNPEFDYFPKALTENLINQISKISSIRTISYSTMESFQNPDTALDSIASVVKVSTILKGSVEKLGSGVKISLQLVDVEKDKNIWTESYIRKGSEIPQFQNEMAREIAKILDARLTAEEATQIGKGETSNPEAYDLLSKAKQLYGEGFENPSLFFEASTLLKKAIELDPNYALAYTLLAKTYFQIAFDYPDEDWYELSLDMSSRALELEPKLAEAFNARAMVYYDLGQYSKAKNSLETATAYFPNLSDAIGNMATIQFAQGNLEEAIKHQTKSLNLGPKAYLPYQNIGWAHKILGNYPEAHLWLNKSLEQSQVPSTYQLIASTYILEGKRDSARLQARKILALKSPDLKEVGYIYFYLNEMDTAFKYLGLKMLGYAGHKYPRYFSVPIPYSYLLKQRGNTQLADSILNEIIQVKTEAISLGYEDYYLPLDLAIAFAVKNQPSESMKYLQIAYEKGWKDYFFTEYNPIFKNLRSDDRYKKILSQLQDDLEKTKKNLSSNSLQRDM